MPELLPLAHHSLLAALPFVVPMVIVVSFLAVMKIHDRREEAREAEYAPEEARSQDGRRKDGEQGT